jgi:cytosine deaminase
MAADTIQQGWDGRATVSHCTAMHSWDNAYAFKAIRLLARGRLNVICNPYDNIILQGRFDTYPKRRGMARLKELLAAGVNVSLGHDSIMDPWYPLGRGDMLAAASLALHIAQMSGRDEIGAMYELITTNAAQTLNISDRYGIEEGKPANLIVLDASSPEDALRLTPARLHVIKDGHVIASTTPSQSTLRRAGAEETVTFVPQPAAE